MATDCEVVEGRAFAQYGAKAFSRSSAAAPHPSSSDLDEARQGLALLMKQQAGHRNMQIHRPAGTRRHCRTEGGKRISSLFTAKVQRKPPAAAALTSYRTLTQ
ncbi:MAG: hypothetical protein ACLUAM_02320 [Bifidobacterium adolescentis]